MITLNRTFQIARRTLAFSAVLGMGIAVAHAQQAAAPAVTAQPALNFQVPVDSANSTFSSSAASNDVANSEVADTKAPIDFLAAAGVQPPPRGRYNRPRYRGGNQNADGSDKYTFLIGGGLAQPLGNTYHYNTPSWGFQVGGGRNFNKNVGVMAQFDWDTFGLNGRTLSQQSFIYFGDPDPSDNGLDANAHIWSISLDPTYSFGGDAGLGAYIVAGAGFYHKVTNFTLPEQGEQCDYYYGCYPVEANVNVDTYTSNAPGFNGGFGLTYKASRFSNARFYGEVRYVVTLNSQRQGLNFANLGTLGPTYTGYNYYPANSNRTTYVPVKFGLRF